MRATCENVDGAQHYRALPGSNRFWSEKLVGTRGFEPPTPTTPEDGVTVRLTRDIWQIESEHIELAKTISVTTKKHGAVADRSAVQEVQFAIAAKADLIDVDFWRAVLGYSVAADDNSVDPLGHGSTVWMQEIDSSKSLRHAMHIDVSLPKEQIQERLTAAPAAGGSIVDDSHAPSHWTLADRVGNRVCIAGWPDGSALGGVANGLPCIRMTHY
jgi:4a-hydroxytetrahydrobiopterin dehydratase